MIAKAGIVVLDNGCWDWEGPKGHYGNPLYGGFGCCLSAQRVIYSLENDLKLMYLHVETTCGMRWCCNPDHMTHRYVGKPNARARSAAELLAQDSIHYKDGIAKQDAWVDPPVTIRQT
jgi:hypothetical protein